MNLRKKEWKRAIFCSINIMFIIFLLKILFIWLKVKNGIYLFIITSYTCVYVCRHRHMHRHRHKHTSACTTHRHAYTNRHLHALHTDTHMHRREHTSACATHTQAHTHTAAAAVAFFPLHSSLLLNFDLKLRERRVRVKKERARERCYMNSI